MLIHLFFRQILNFPEDGIPNAKVTHIWTQDREKSEDVAKASLIENVVDTEGSTIPEQGLAQTEVNNISTDQCGGNPSPKDGNIDAEKLIILADYKISDDYVIDEFSSHSVDGTDKNQQEITSFTCN